MERFPYRVVLASASPRRAELLGELIAEFEVCPCDIDEELYVRLAPEDTAVDTAAAKAECIAKLHPNALVIAGDTVVALNESGRFVHLGKPVDDDDAVKMLTLLSGRVHEVVTGICLTLGWRRESFCERTKVAFRNLSLAEIEEYVASGEPHDKAGAYAIQGGAAGYVAKIEGSYSNVVGLPLEALQIHLEQFLR